MGTIALQRRLQEDSFGIFPDELEGNDLSEFIIWNIVALNDELHEALHEVPGWKPWSSKETPSLAPETTERQMYLEELVDAQHFLNNLVLAASCGDEEFEKMYAAKVEENARRQREGYSK